MLDCCDTTQVKCKSAKLCKNHVNRQSIQAQMLMLVLEWKQNTVLTERAPNRVFESSD